jgi:hypothetical protein
MRLMLIFNLAATCTRIKLRDQALRTWQIFAFVPEGKFVRCVPAAPVISAKHRATGAVLL